MTESLDIQQYTSFENQPHLSNIPRNWNQDQQFEFDLINHELVKAALQRMKAKKATGHDHIPPRALKASIPSITRPLSHLINTIITSRAVPDSWKRAVEDNLSSDIENATTRFIQNGMRPIPEKYQAMVLSRTEDKLLLLSGKIDIRTAEKTNLWGVVLDSKLRSNDQVSSICRTVLK